MTRHDLPHVVRQLLRAPGFSLTVILTLALGIGLNTAIFTVVDTVLLRPLGYRDADRIVALRTRLLGHPLATPRLGGDDYSDVAAQVHSLESAAYYNFGMEGISLDGRALYLSLASVSPRFAEVIGVEPVAGRVFHGSDQDGEDVLIGQALAEQQFGSAQAALGHRVRFAGSLRSIVGVLPASFSFPAKTSVWIEAAARPEVPNRTAYNQFVIAKLRPGISLPQLREELALFSKHLAAAYPEDQDKTLEAISLQESIVGAVRSTLYLLLGAVGVVLLIVWANVTHFQLVRATRQQHMLSIRTALGASRFTLAVRALLEASVLGVAGCAAAVLLAVPALRVLIHLAPANLPRLQEVRLNWQILLFSAFVSLALMSLTALLPVLRFWQIQPGTALRGENGRTTEGPGSRKLRHGFLMTQIAATVTLLVVALLLTRRLVAEGRQQLGFAPEHLLVVDAHLIQSTPPVPEPPSPTQAAMAAYRAQQQAVWKQGEARLQSTLTFVEAFPGVASVSAVRGAPMGFDGPDVSYAIRGKQSFTPPYHDLPVAEIRTVTPDYTADLRIPLRRGRNLSPQDRLGSPWVVVIDEAMAQQSFAGTDPIGKQILCGLSDDQNWMTIVGVVGSIRFKTPGEQPSPMMYVPIAQYPWAAADVQIVVRTAEDPAAMMHSLEEHLRRTHPELALRMTTMQENISSTQRQDRFRDLLFGSFAAVSLLLAILGIYGTTAYSTTQRSFEFGLRFALGAGRVQILLLVLRSALFTVLVGVVLGFALSLLATRLLSSVIGHLPALDIPVYMSAFVSMLLLAAMAALFPARKAAASDPMQVLRSS